MMAEQYGQGNVWTLRKMQDMGNLEQAYYITKDFVIYAGHLVHTYIHIHTYIHTYVHTYIHTYTHTYMPLCFTDPKFVNAAEYEPYQ
jgi:hypothetical protein